VDVLKARFGGPFSFWGVMAAGDIIQSKTGYVSVHGKPRPWEVLAPWIPALEG